MVRNIIYEIDFDLMYKTKYTLGWDQTRKESFLLKSYYNVQTILVNFKRKSIIYNSYVLGTCTQLADLTKIQISFNFGETLKVLHPGIVK